MVDWRGRAWNLTADWAAGLKSGGIEGLVGGLNDSALSPLGEPGQVVTGQTAGAMSGSLTVHCRAHGGRDAGEVAARFRAAFSPKIGRETTLTVASPIGAVHTQVRLSGPIDAPVEDPASSAVVLNVRVPLVADSAAWWSPRPPQHERAVVNNGGDVPVWVRIRWEQAGVVRLPSGAQVTLPSPPGPRTLHLSRAKSVAVFDDDGFFDRVTWQRVRGAWVEGVAPGETGVFHLPTGAELVYEVGVLDPWT